MKDTIDKFEQCSQCGEWIDLKEDDHSTGQVGTVKVYLHLGRCREEYHGTLVNEVVYKADTN